jgi:WD40 repeat protein
MFLRRTLLVPAVTVLLFASSCAHAADADKPRLDTYGDPLPAEALIRLGPSRFRTEGQAAALSPDGKTIALAAPSALVLLDAASGKERGRFKSDDSLGIGSIVFSPDGKKIVLASDLGVQLYDAATGNVLGSFDRGGFNRGRSISFSEDGKRLALGSTRGGQKLTATVWDVEELKKVQSVEVPQEYSVSVALSGDGKLLVTWGQSLGGNAELSRTIQFWDTATGKEVKKIVADGYNIVTAALSPDGKQLAISQGGSALTVLDVESGKPLYTLATRRATRGLLRFSPDGKRLVAGTADGAVQSWDAATGKRLGMAAGPHCAVMSVALLPENKVLALGVDQQALHLWEGPASRVLSPTDGHNSPPTTLCFSADGKTVLSGAADGVRLWDAATGKMVRHLPLRDTTEQYPTGPPRRFVLSPDARQVLTDSQRGGAARLVDIASEQEQFALNATANPSLQATVFSADGKTLALDSGRFIQPGRTRAVELWDLAAGRERIVLEVKAGAPMVVAVSPDGAAVLTALNFRGATTHSELTLWDAATGKERWTKDNPGESTEHLAFSPTGEFIARAGMSGIQLWDAATGTILTRFDKTDDVDATCLLFSPDGRTLAAGARSKKKPRADETVRMWEIASAKLRGEWVGQRGAVAALAFSRDGRTLASSARDTTIVLWDLTGTLNATVSDAAKPKAAEFDALWKELEEADAGTAYRLIQRLARYPTEATALVKANLPATTAKKIDAAEIDKLIADLDNDDFNRREQASKALREMGKPASAALTKALEATQSTERKRRLTELLDALKVKGPRPEMVRPTRALELLERIATPEAKQVLEGLAKGDPDAPLTHDAKATLKRLAVRK